MLHVFIRWFLTLIQETVRRFVASSASPPPPPLLPKDRSSALTVEISFSQAASSARAASASSVADDADIAIIVSLLFSAQER